MVMSLSIDYSSCQKYVPFRWAVRELKIKPDIKWKKFGVRSLPWRFGGKMMAFVRIILERLELRRSIGSQFWARVVVALSERFTDKRSKC